MTILGENGLQTGEWNPPDDRVYLTRRLASESFLAQTMGVFVDWSCGAGEYIRGAIYNGKQSLQPLHGLHTKESAQHSKRRR